MTRKGQNNDAGSAVQAEAFQSIAVAARAGAEWAWSRLMSDVDGALRGYLRRLGASDPDDLAGETWLHIARGIHRFEGDEASFRSWVFMVAHHRVIDDRRRRRRRPLDFQSGPVLDRFAPTSRSAEAEAMDSIEHDYVMEVLEELTAAQREVVLLRVVEGFGINEIAEIVGKKAGAVQALQRRAFKNLETILGKAVSSDPPRSVTGMR